MKRSYNDFNPSNNSNKLASNSGTSSYPNSTQYNHNNNTKPTNGHTNNGLNDSNITNNAITNELQQLLKTSNHTTTTVQHNKPQFLTKAQREQIALQKLQERHQIEQNNVQTTSNSIKQADVSIKQLTTQPPPIQSQSTHRDIRDIKSHKPQHIDPETLQEQQYQYELQQYKLHRLGLKQTNIDKVKIKGNQRTKFNFDWNAADDTAKYIVPIIDTNTTDVVKPRTNSRFDINAPANSKRIHWSDVKLCDMTDRLYAQLCEEFEIKIRGNTLNIKPLRYWNECNIHSKLLTRLEALGYTTPTPIQRAAIPIGLSNVDLIGLAETGSGKTLAFVLPMLMYIYNKCHDMTSIELRNNLLNNGPYAIIMAPTRELAQQIHAECEKFTDLFDIRTVCIIGGVGVNEQSIAMRDGVHIIIATPGRIVDLIDKHYIVLHQCCYIVLDEADRMIDMAFEPQINVILDNMNKSVKRQTIMFSATMSQRVSALSKKYLTEPVIITIGDRTLKAAETVEQILYYTKTDNDKRNKLLEIRNSYRPPFIIFCTLTKTIDTVAKLLDQYSMSYVSVHAKLTQDDRTANMTAFKQGDVDILICTNVAARGIDVSNVQVVVNYEMPQTIEDYTHRIGRTGRAGQKGTAISLINEQDTDIMYDLVKMCQLNNVTVPKEIEKLDSAKYKVNKQGERINDQLE